MTTFFLQVSLNQQSIEKIRGQHFCCPLLVAGEGIEPPAFGL